MPDCKHSVLVVEDDSDLLELVSEVLEENGYRVFRAGTLAAARLQIHLERPNLIVLDFLLPDGDGFELCKEISANMGGSPLIPILLLTGKSGLDQRMKAFLNGARKYLEKPFDIDVLVDTVKSMSAALPVS